VTSAASGNSATVGCFCSIVEDKTQSIKANSKGKGE
ncbi:unnamed protein product, partial [marine sediment metagenome]